MKRKEVRILGLSYSQSQNGSYVVVLSEIKGTRKLPVIVKPADAQQIALKIEGVELKRPLTHDIFKTLTDSFSIDISEVFIHSIIEGIFYTKIIATNGVDEIEIECGTGDGISLALVYGCPIQVSSDILDEAGVQISDDGMVFDDDDEDIYDEDDNEFRVVSIEDLEHMMNDAISNEEYEIAAELRDRIQTLKQGS